VPPKSSLALSTSHMPTGGDAVKRQRPNVIQSCPISSDDATDLKHSLINHVTRRWINALCVADEFADRAASVQNKAIVDREEVGR